MPNGRKISQFPAAAGINNADVVGGVQNGVSTKFSFATIFLWLKSVLIPSDIGAVPTTRTVNGKSLDNDISLNATDVGARDANWMPTATDVGARPNTWTPSAADVGAQPTITTSGILKGDGQGGVNAATAGMDYQAPLTFDANPTASSTNPVQSGGVYSDVRTRVPNYGKGKNLLRNWYFVGGGTGRGVFPVNQRGKTSYSGGTSIFDGWTADSNTGITFGASGITVSLLSGSSTNIYQRCGTAPLGKALTMSVLTSTGIVSVSGTMPSTLPSNNQTILTVGASTDGYRFRLYLQPAGTMYAEFRAYATQTWVAAKLELGSEQTLAHQEGSTWVLNELPDYEYELYRCITSTADPSDTYANKSLATEQQLAYVETGTTASRAYSVGEYFCWNGLLYRVTSAISSGQSFNPGSNCGQVTVGAELQKVVFNKQTTNGTFYDIAPGWAARALDGVVSNISNYQSGVYNVSSSGGPDFIVVLGKYSNSYYSGLIFNYNSSFFGLFQYFNGQKTLKQIAQI